MAVDDRGGRVDQLAVRDPGVLAQSSEMAASDVVSACTWATGTSRARSCRSWGWTTRCVTRRVLGSMTMSASSPNEPSVQSTELPSCSRIGDLERREPRASSLIHLLNRGLSCTAISQSDDRLPGQPSERLTSPTLRGQRVVSRWERALHSRVRRRTTPRGSDRSALTVLRVAQRVKPCACRDTRATTLGGVSAAG